MEQEKKAKKQNRGKVILFSTLAVLLAVLVAGGSVAWVLLNSRAKAREPVPVSGSQTDTTQVRYIAHRGFSAVAPENTVPAITKAGEAGFWGAEFDIHRTKDGKWLVMHDDWLSRMTKSLGFISNMTYDEVRKAVYDNGANYADYPELKVPTLEEVLEECKNQSLHPVIEVKEDVSGGLDDLLRIVDDYGFTNNCTIISFGKEHLKALRGLNQDIALWYLSALITEEAVALCHDYNFGLDFDGRKEENTPELVRQTVASGLTCGAWTIDTIELHDQLVASGIQFITSNTLAPRQ